MVPGTPKSPRAVRRKFPSLPATADPLPRSLVAAYRFTSARWRESMVSISGQRTCLLLALSIFGASTGTTIIPPGGPLNGKRNIISFAEHQTTEDRRAYLQEAQEQGYTCWMNPENYRAAVCTQVPLVDCSKMLCVSVGQPAVVQK